MDKTGSSLCYGDDGCMELTQDVFGRGSETHSRMYYDERWMGVTQGMLCGWYVYGTRLRCAVGWC